MSDKVETGKDMSQEELDKIKELAAEGHGIAEIAEIVGLHFDWGLWFPKAQEANLIGSEIADARIMKTLYDAAIAGDVMACIFWLSCRKPQEWGDTSCLMYRT